VTPAEPAVVKESNCPDCGRPWPSGPSCPACGLDIEDVAAAADFYVIAASRAALRRP
jgi:hypothetical protein